jgi:hypothetical protein
MTALGKVLVFVNLVFSLVTAGLITMVFIARTNWKVGFDNLQKQVEVARADLAAERDSKALVQQHRAAEKSAADKTLAAVNAEVQKFKDQLEAEKVQRTQAQSELAQAKAINETSKEENKRLVAEQKDLQGQLQKRDQEIVVLKRENLGSRDRAVQFELAYQSTKARAEALLAQLTDANKQLRTVQAQGGPGGGRSVLSQPVAPPAEDVRGKVTQVDTTQRLATVSVGSDLGVVKGTTLELFRIDADPSKSLYLGTLEIISATPKQAIGRYTLVSSRNPLKVGDEVASRLSVSH